MFTEDVIKVHKHMTPTYTLELTQDEYVAIIAAIFTSTKDNLNKCYAGYFPSKTVDDIDEELQKLAIKFSNTYKEEKLVNIIKEIRLDGLKELLK